MQIVRDDTFPTVRQRIKDSCELATKRILEAAESLTIKDGQVHLDYLFRFKEIEKKLDQEIVVHRELARVPAYITSSLFLQESYTYLTEGPAEQMHYVTGTRIGNMLSLDRLVTFKYTRHSLVGVEGAPHDTLKALLMLERFGHKLLGWFHSHPGSGHGASIPSQIDLNHQRRLEMGGYPAIGAVFTRDGYVRFFSLNRNFRIEIYGKGVEKIDGRLFRIRVNQD